VWPTSVSKNPKGPSLRLDRILRMCMIAQDLGASGRFPAFSVQSYILRTHQNQNCDRLPYVVRIHHSPHSLSLSLFLIPTSQEANARERVRIQSRQNLHLHGRRLLFLMQLGLHFGYIVAVLGMDLADRRRTHAVVTYFLLDDRHCFSQTQKRTRFWQKIG
jgi:hypothetical protein